MNLSCAGQPKLVTLGMPGRIDRGVEVNDEITEFLAWTNAVVAIGVSGGKDSCAAAIATVEYLRSVDFTGTIILVHADLGDPDPALDVEWEDSLPTCERLAAFLGVELLVVRRAAGGMMKRWQKRQANNVHRYANLLCVKVILPFSTPKMRFCTSELKSAPIAAGLVRRFPGKRIVSACGVRRAESKERAKTKTMKLNKRLTNAKHKTSGVDWNPIAHWSEQDVFAFCASRGFRMHNGYTEHGMGRISCRFCIMQDASDRRASAAVPANRPVGFSIVKLECASTFGFWGSQWLADVLWSHLDEVTRNAVTEAKARAKQRAAIESRVPEHLLYTKGWPTVMPTREEAELLCEVRIAIAALMGFEVKYTDPDSLTARYAELMAENKRREAEKAAKAERKVQRAARRTRPS